MRDVDRGALGAALVALTLALGCGGEAEAPATDEASETRLANPAAERSASTNDAVDPTEPPATPLTEDERTEVRSLSRALADDPVRVTLRDVDEASAGDLPVRASDILRERSIPAARARHQALADLERSTPRASALRDACREAAEERSEALVEYAEVLARGLVEDLRLVDASQRHRRAEAAMIAATVRVRALAAE